MNAPATTLPAFSLKGIDGKAYSPESFKEKKILLFIFWAPHCPYVHAYEDRIIHFQEDFSPSGIQVVAINSNTSKIHDDDGEDGMRARAEKKSYNFPFLIDAEQAAAKAFGATKSPEAFLYDHERVLRYHGKIDDSWSAPYKVTKPYLRQAIQALLQGKEPPFQEKPPIGCDIDRPS